MPTARRFNRRAYQCSLYEAQDVLVDVDDVDLILLEPGRAFRFKEGWQRRLLYRDFARPLVHVNPGLRRVALKQDYDLFVAVCQNHWDLLYINAIDGWKDRCRTSVCWIDEIWAADIPLCGNWLHALTKFDHVFVGFRGTVEPLSKAIGKPCRWLPGAVDALRFSPYPEPPPRVIDVYSLGRRWEGIDQASLKSAAQDGIFYLHDTFPAMANMKPYDLQQHRSLFANVAKRSRHFMVAPAKMNLSSETQGQVEIGYRYFEGAVAGTVMIGQPPDCAAFKETFPWPDVVIPIQPDGSDVLDVLAELRSDQARTAKIGRRNAGEALLRHDWVHRWREIFLVAGLEPSPGLVARERQLQHLADLASNANMGAGATSTHLPQGCQ